MADWSDIRDIKSAAMDRRALLRTLVLGLAWIVLWRASALMEYAPHASIWFPPAGLTFAAFLVLGLRAAPVILLCSVVVTFWADAMYAIDQTWRQTLVSGVLFGVAHCAAYGAAAAVLRRMLVRASSDALPVLIITFLVLAALAALLAALLGIQMLLFGGLIDPPEAKGLWLPWWIGDMAGTIVLAPLFAGLLSWGRNGLADWPQKMGLLGRGVAGYHWLFKVVVLAGLLTMIMVLTARSEHSELLSFAVFFLIIPQMWITYTESALRVAVSLAVFCTLTAVWVGVFGLMEQAMVYQFAITVIAASTYFGLAVPVLVDHNRKLQALTDADELTGVTSRRFFFEQARFDLALARRRNRPVSLVLFDIDRFKQVNDDYGHIAGDRALVAATDAAREILRQEDLLGRFGGDEFMLLLTGCGRCRALETAERLRAALKKVEVPGTGQHLSGSFSVVQLGDNETLMEAFERADTILLAAKRAGRDCVLTDAEA